SSASGVRATHAYTRPGVYRVRLTVTDDEGATTWIERGVSIVDSRPTALAHPRTARHGAHVRLPYLVTDDVRVDRARIDIRVGRRDVRFDRSIRSRSSSGFVTW